MSKYSVEELRPIIDLRKPILLNKVGFEDRSITSVIAHPDLKWTKVLTLASTERSDKAHANLERLEHALNLKGAAINVIAELSETDPLDVELSISRALDTLENNWSDGELWIDFTALRREELLILVRLLVERYDANSLCKIFGLYVSAAKMGKWLSGDIVDIRSVVGYPGEISPARSTTLIILMGFEINRARAIIEAYEPSQVFLGTPALEGSINRVLFERNQEVVRRVSEDYTEIVSRKFSFSANDPSKALSDLSAILSECGDDNVVIAPLHTKISTLAAGVVALRNPKIQICYAAVDEYNEAAYSKQSGEIYLLPFSFLKA